MLDGDLLTEQFRDNILYFDTDSVAYVKMRGMRAIRESDLLGSMNSEIAAHTRVLSWVCTGAKSYCLVIENDLDGTKKTKIKFKGIMQSESTKSLLTEKGMLDMLSGTHTHLEQENFKRNKARSSIETVRNLKVARCTFTKRIRRKDGIRTYPIGWGSTSDNAGDIYDYTSFVTNETIAQDEDEQARRCFASANESGDELDDEDYLEAMFA